MDDWGQAFDDQCRAEGLEVPEKVEENPSTQKMEQNEENKGFQSFGIGRGGVFGGPPKTMNAPPPQTSFGATSGTRIGGAFGNQSNGPDGRGAPIGSTEEAVGGGNVISVGFHKEKSACTFTRGGGFGTNRSTTPTSPTSFKTNHEGGRFGTLAPKLIEQLSSENSENTKLGGSFGVSRNTESTRTSVGGGFGSTRSAVSSSTSRTSIGGSFGSKSTSSDAVEAATTIGGSFGARTTTNPPSSIGGSFGSAKPSASTGSVGGSFGSKLRDTVTTGGAFERTHSNGGAVGGSFGASKSSSSVGDVSSGQRITPDVPKKTTTSSFGLASTVASSTTQFKMIGESFGSRRILPEIPDLSIPPPPIFGGGFGGNRSMETRSDLRNSDTRTLEEVLSTVNTSSVTRSSNPFVEKTLVGGGYYIGSKENEDPTPKTTANEIAAAGRRFGSKLHDDYPDRSTRGGFGTERSRENRDFVCGFRQEKSQEILPTEEDEIQVHQWGVVFCPSDTASEHVPTRDEPLKTRAPFGSQPQTRGGFHGGFRGGRGSGGQMDFGAGQGHPMGRGRGQPTQQFIPQQRSTPSFAGNHQNPPVVMPDPKFKYTKPQEELHEQAPIPADIALLNKFIQKEVKMMKDTVVDVQRQDPKSPLYSISSFRELRLKPEVLQALDTLNFQFPTRIQETALPLLLMEPPSNLIAQAQSGTGKTAAFVLTMLCRIDVSLQYPQCICLAPTLELAKQIGEVVEKMGKFMENLKIHYAIKGGNMAAMRGRKLTEQIVIGTPGITRDYLQKYKCIDPSKIRCLVLDEADVMIYHQGFTDISTTIYNMVEEASDSVQSMLFSATYDEPVITFATKIIKNAIVVMLKREEQALPNIKQFYVQCACRDSKYAAIVNLYSGLAVASSVIFCHTKASVMWLFENMKARGHQVDVLHGDMTVVERADTIIRFKRGDFKVLITTNVFARGIDVAQVSVVINYDLPIKYDDTGNPMIVDGFTQPDCETYLHRIGRTGRFGKTGIAINFIDSEDSMNMINVLENHFQMKITRMDPSNLIELEAIEMA